MSSSANQQSRIMGLRRPNKRARVDPIVVRVVPTMAAEIAWMEESRAWMVKSSARVAENTAWVRRASEDALLRLNKRAQVDPVVPPVDPIVAGVVPTMAEETAWMRESGAPMAENATWTRRAWEDTLAAQARLNEESERLMQASLAEHFSEFMRAGNIRVFGGNEGSVFCLAWGDYDIRYHYDKEGNYLGYVCCDKMVTKSGIIMKHSNSCADVGTVCHPISLSSDSVSGEADGRELEDDGASAT